MALSTHVKVTGLVYSSKQKVPIPWTHLSPPTKRFKRCLETFPQSRVGIKLASSSPSISDHISITPHCHQVSHEIRSFKSTTLILPAGWIFIFYQSKLTARTKVFTHNSTPNILVFCMSSGFGRKCQTSFSYKYSHCFERWVGPNYLSSFEVSVDMLIWGCRVELPRFSPHIWARPNSGSISQTTSRHLLNLPFICIQWTHSRDHSTCSESTGLTLYPSIT